MVAQSMQHEEPESVFYAEVVFCEYHGNLITHNNAYNSCNDSPPNMRSVPTPMTHIIVVAYIMR